jgi:4-hydroxyphenylpyruvate dioxygenase
VKDLDHTKAFLAKRAATFLGDDVDVRDAQGGRFRSFSIATAIGDVAFKFVERSDFSAFAPGFEDSPNDAAPTNRFGFIKVDHVTINARTMAPLLEWYARTLGMQQFWDIQFHTEDVAPGRAQGTGLKSIVMWEPESGIKFANNEPLAPFYEDSQIAKFVYDNHGPGIQHLAFTVPEIIPVVEELRHRHVAFLPTPGAYYRDLPKHLEKLKISNVKESLATLEKNEILVDGSNDKYMLQIFLREAAGLYDDERAGPFFYEIIQREGDQGFGYGNFRALFESIEREQQRSRLSPAGLSIGEPTDACRQALRRWSGSRSARVSRGALSRGSSGRDAGRAVPGGRRSVGALVSSPRLLARDGGALRARRSAPRRHAPRRRARDVTARARARTRRCGPDGARALGVVDVGPLVSREWARVARR